MKGINKVKLTCSSDMSHVKFMVAAKPLIIATVGLV